MAKVKNNCLNCNHFEIKNTNSQTYYCKSFEIEVKHIHEENICIQGFKKADRPKVVRSNGFIYKTYEDYLNSRDWENKKERIL